MKPSIRANSLFYVSLSNLKEPHQEIIRDLVSNEYSYGDTDYALVHDHTFVKTVERQIENEEQKKESLLALEALKELIVQGKKTMSPNEYLFINLY